MNFPPGIVQKTYRKIGRKLVEVGILSDSNAKTERIAQLNLIIRQADLANDLVNSDGWKELVNPWVQAEMNADIEAWSNHRSRYKEDIGAYHHSGRLQFAADLTGMLKSVINQKETARRELLSLTDKELQ